VEQGGAEPSGPSWRFQLLWISTENGNPFGGGIEYFMEPRADLGGDFLSWIIVGVGIGMFLDDEVSEEQGGRGETIDLD
jgi:hypothetical protein